MTKIYHLIVPLLFLAIGSSRVEAASLKVSPAGFIIHNVVPGRTYDVYAETGLQLSIYNDDKVAHTYSLSTHRPSEGGRWEKGYLEIPEAQWCRFEHDEITIGAFSNGYARCFLLIPDEERYYNQHWVVTMGVADKPGLGGIGVAVDIRAQIETQSRTRLRSGHPDGLMGIVPSTLVLSPTEKGEVVVFNNGTTSETYKIYALADKSKWRTYMAAGFLALPDADWLDLGVTSLTIPAGGKSPLSITAALPEAVRKSADRYEAIILVEGKGATGFLRVRIMESDAKKAAVNRDTQ